KSGEDPLRSHAGGMLFEVLFIVSLARVGSGLHQYTDGNASIFVADCSVLCVLHDYILLFIVFVPW
ncbi:MAG: hypothetical protein ACLPVW_11115, partial [Terriglobales bacterium]